MKKTIVFLLAVFALFGIAKAGDTIHVTTGTGYYLTYEYDDLHQYLTLTDCLGGPNSPAALVIPSSINGYPVKVIGDFAFQRCNMTSVVIPNSITEIGRGAFNQCNNITTVTIPESVKKLGTGCFVDCRNLDTLYYNATCATTWGSLG